MIADNEPQEIGERSFAFAVRIVKPCRKLEHSPGIPRVLSNQLLRSGTSIGANLAESKSGQSRADYTSKVSIALKEARETYYWLRLIGSTETMPAQQLGPITDEADEIIAILTTIVKKLKTN